jgi:hypothetical protein
MSTRMRYPSDLQAQLPNGFITLPQDLAQFHKPLGPEAEAVGTGFSPVVPLLIDEPDEF